MDFFKQTLERQVRQVFRTLIESVENCPEADFYTGAENWNASIGDQVWHMVISLDYAFPNDEFKSRWSEKFTEKEQGLACLRDCRDLLLLPYIQSNDLLSADAQPEYFISGLDRLMKLLRHTAQHTGAINRLLGEKGLAAGTFI